MEGLSAMPAISQIVIAGSSSKCHNLCVERPSVLSHIVNMSGSDKNDGPVTLKAWREHAQLSQAELASLVGTNANMIGYLEKGVRALNVHWMRRLAKVLKTKPGALVDDLPGEAYRVPSASQLSDMVHRAMMELPPGVTYAEFPQAVSVSLHDQLERFQVGDEVQDDLDASTVPDTIAQLPPPTTQLSAEEERNT